MSCGAPPMPTPLSTTFVASPRRTGWAVTATEAGTWWGALRRTIASGRSEEVDVLEKLASGNTRMGIKAQAEGQPCRSCSRRNAGKVAVEGTAADEARATFVYRTEDVDRLNVALLLTSFRREAISLPEDQLGRWSLAVRTLEVVRWGVLDPHSPVVHDDVWADNLGVALG